MKVLHVIPSISPARGGPSKAIFEMVGALRAEGIDAEIATTNDNVDQPKLDIPLNQRYEYQTEQGECVPVFCFDRYVSSSSFVHEFTVSTGLTSFLWRQIPHYDIVHIHAIFSFPSVMAMAIANFCRVPYVIRPLGSLCHWSLEQSKAQKRIYLSLIRRFLDQASGLHLTSEQERQEVEPLKLKCDRFVLPLGIDLRGFTENSPIDIRQKYQIDNSDPILLFLSRIHPKKGIEPLLKAIADIPARPLNLILAGTGETDYERSIQGLIAERQLTERVKTVGFVQGDLKQALLSQSDLFVLTSHSENFGIVVLEALAAGTPTLVTPGVALASLVQEHDLGWVCDLDQSAIRQTVEQALSNGQALRQKGQRARKLVQEQYSWTAIAQRLIQQYQQAQPSKKTFSLFSSFKNA